MNYMRSGKEQLVASINRNNVLPVLILADEVTISQPSTSLQGNTNTVVTITAKPDSLNWQGSFTYRYNRSRVDYLKGLVVPGAKSDYSDVRSALRALFDKYFIIDDPDNYVNYTLGPSSNPGCEVRPNVDNLIYFTNYQITIPFEN